MSKLCYSISGLAVLILTCLAGSFGCGREEDSWSGGEVANTTPIAIDEPDQPAEPDEPIPEPINVGPGTPPVPGEVVAVCMGSDPDVAVDSKGHLHLVYVRDGLTWYTEYDYVRGVTLVPEVIVGGGDDPQIALDSNGRAHVAFGNVYYSYQSGNGFSAPELLVTGKAKPRISIDPLNRVYVVGMRDTVPRNKLFVFENNTRIIDGITVGDNDIGGIDADASGRLHICWRSGRALYYTSYSIGEDPNGVSGRSVAISGAASDFSDIAADYSDGSLHVTHTHAFAGGIDYVYRNSSGTWSADINYAAEDCLDGADDIQPTTDVDAGGLQYVVFTGDHFLPKYYVVGATGSILVPTADIDSSHESGGKKKNPNVASRPDMNGAYVAWGVGTVYVRSLGNISFEN